MIKPNIELKVALIRNGMTQRELSKKLNIDETILSRVFKGHMNLDENTEYKIAEILEVPREQIFSC